MVAYSFQPRFVAPIREGRKRWTIRRPRKRHAAPGEALQLYTGMRTAFCRKIVDDPVCRWVLPVELLIEDGRIAMISIDGVALVAGAFDLFAEDDGFADAADMHAFWLRHHAAGLFQGVLIEWQSVEKVLEAA